MWVSLKKKEDFILLKKRGKRLKKQGFFMIYRQNDLSYCRKAFSFPRWTGKAVQRKRFKRWAHHFLLRKKELKGWDILLGFERREELFYKEMNYKAFCRGFEQIYRRIDFE